MRSDNGVPFASAHSLFNLNKLAINLSTVFAGQAVGIKEVHDLYLAGELHSSIPFW
jgi:hypothetical protein